MKLPGTSVLRLSQSGRGFFISANNIILISIPDLAFIIKFLIQNNYMSRKVLEGILTEVTE
jgi:hypothetical protein